MDQSDLFHLDAMPTAGFIFSFHSSGSTFQSNAPLDSVQPASTVPLRPRLSSVLHFASPVRCLQWHPSLPQLVLVCATSAVYSWFPLRPGLAPSSVNASQPTDYCEGIGVPAGVFFSPDKFGKFESTVVLLMVDAVYYL